MIRAFCDICNHELKDGKSASLRLNKKYETHDMRICDTCYRRMVYIVRNDTPKEIVKNMSFMNRLRMVFLRDVKKEDADNETT